MLGPLERSDPIQSLPDQREGVEDSAVSLFDSVRSGTGRTALILRVQFDLTVDEIAYALDVPATQVRSALADATHELRKVIEDGR